MHFFWKKHNMHKHRACIYWGCIYWMVMGRDGLTRWHDVLSESWVCNGRDGVAVDVELPSLDGQCVGQSEQTQLGSTVVGLAKVAINPCSRSGHDDSDQRTPKTEPRSAPMPRRDRPSLCSDGRGICMHKHPITLCVDAIAMYVHDMHYLPSKLLFLHVVPCCPCHVEGTPEVNSLDKVWRKKNCTTVCSIIMTT